MSTPGGKALYYQRVVAAADAAKVPVSAVYGRLTDFVDHLGPGACEDCGAPVRSYHGKALCAEHVRERKRLRDRERMRYKRLLTGDHDLIPVECWVLCADCGERKLGGFLHAVVLAPFCPGCGMELVAMRQNKGLSWDR